MKVAVEGERKGLRVEELVHLTRARLKYLHAEIWQQRTLEVKGSVSGRMSAVGVGLLHFGH